MTSKFNGDIRVQAHNCDKIFTNIRSFSRRYYLTSLAEVITTNICKKLNLTSLPSNLRQDHPRMRAFSYACSLPVSVKDVGYTIRSAVPENPTLHANMTAVCLLELELLLIEILHSGSRNFRRFRLLWTWPWRVDLGVDPNKSTLADLVMNSEVESGRFRLGPSTRRRILNDKWLYLASLQVDFGKVIVN